MLINIRGIHGSGKSTVARKLLKELNGRPIFGLLGPKMPEAYVCTSPEKRRTYILGPYNTEGTAGGDYLTKRGVEKTVETLERYFALGHVIFESVLVSTRFMEPSIGAWMVKHKEAVLHATLDTSYEVCLKSVLDRQKRSVIEGTPPKHIERQWVDLQNVTRRLTGLGFRMETVSRGNAVTKVVTWLEEAP